jgi:hypothetical protein
MRRLVLLFVIAVPACVSSGRQVELAGVAPPRQGVRSTAPTTVDLLPIESQVVAYPGHRFGGGGAAMALRAAVISALPPALGARRFRLASLVDRTGRGPMSARELAATRAELIRYAREQLVSPHHLVPLALPYRLGRTSGARATLFVAGYGIAGDDATHMEDVLAALALTEAVFATVGAIGEVVDNHDGVDAAARYADHMENVSATLDYVEATKRLRPPRSSFRLVLTLVDNATGQVIWHSDKVFTGRDPTDAKAVRRAVERSLRHLPRPG